MMLLGLLATIGFAKEVPQDSLTFIYDDGYSFKIVAEDFYMELTGTELDSTQGVYYVVFKKTAPMNVKLSYDDSIAVNPNDLKWLIMIFEKDQQKYLIGIYRDDHQIIGSLLFTCP